MPFQIPTLAQTKDRMLAAIQRAFGLDAPPPDASTDAILGKAVAGQMQDAYYMIDQVRKGILPTEETETEELVRHGADLGIVKRPATVAMGAGAAVGEDGRPIPSGSRLVHESGVQVETTADAVIAAGAATMSLQALAPDYVGAVGNLPPGAELRFVSPVRGIQPVVVLDGAGMVGGVDEESDESLLARIRFRRRYPPSGGNQYDFVAWAMELPFVAAAWCTPLGMGRGTVVVRFTIPAAAGGPIPTAEHVDEVLAYLRYHLHPVTGDPVSPPNPDGVYVFAPVAKLVTPRIRLYPDTAANRAAAEAELAAFQARDSAPGATLYLTRLSEAVSLAVGEHHHDLLDPPADVTPLPGEMFVLAPPEWVE